ncbi:hypothetical protein [Carbonactinospora thermoautotrophica]|uniref:hypothetical protein n=1 Tax=Carbonactinospora thermoautotrophica TaxID=1469144 RepID=UPI002271207E|nr:hypothetical protein [Carbonactinospora thermoautotrophica]
MSPTRIRCGPALALGAVLTLAVPLCAACGQQDGPRAAPPPAGQPAGELAGPPEVPAELVAQARRVRADRLVAEGRGVRVEEVRLPQPYQLQAGQPAVQRLLRITVEGRFQARALPLVLYVDGVPVSRAVEAPDLRSVSAVLLDPGLVRDGARVSYRYGGHGPQTAAGTLRVVR